MTAPFSCAGTCLPEEPVTFIFRDQTRFEITRAKNAFEQKNELKPLLERCKPAPFGDGKKTRYDRNVRDALQLKAEWGGFSIAGFGPESAGILKRIQRQSKQDRDPELPAAARLHSCDYCPWGYFGNESSEVDLYTFAGLHIEIPKFGQGPRAATKPSTGTIFKPKRSTRKSKAKHE